MPTIEEQKIKLRNKNISLNLGPKRDMRQFIENNMSPENRFISHNAAIKQLLKDCKISAPANGDKTVVTKVVKAHKSLRMITSIDYILVDGKLQQITETKEVNIKDYSYTIKIKTDIQTLQGVK